MRTKLDSDFFDLLMFPPFSAFYRFPFVAEALADPKHEQHAELLEWQGPFDPEAFDALSYARVKASQ